MTSDRAATPPVLIRRAGPDDIPAVVSLCSSALGWRDGEPNEALFRWKHLENPFGPSPMWVAEVDGELVAVRVFLRWRFNGPGGGFDAFRAVDTATHPGHRGRGLFSSLTLSALPDLRQDGGAFVFNTPNTASRPGYEKMGWQVLGRAPVSVAVAGPRSAARLARARVAGSKWSEPCTLGHDPAVVFSDAEGVGQLLARTAVEQRLHTARCPAYLLWRYGRGPVTYRVVTLSGGPDVGDGCAVVRCRRRGSSLEADVAELLVPDGGEARRRRSELLRRVLRGTGADHLLVVQAGRVPLAGAAPIPRVGPLVVWRSLQWSRRPRRRGWAWSLGDLELF